MADERRSTGRRDRRANPRGGRRDNDQGKPWYMRRRLWLAAASVAYVGWRRLLRLGRERGARGGGSSLAA